MESLLYKENVSSSRLPPLSQRKRTKVASTANVKAAASKIYDSSEMHDSSRSVKSSVSRSLARNNGTYPAPNTTTSSSAEESCQHLSYIILQQLATTERQNALIHDKLIYNEQKMSSFIDEISRLKKKISDLEERLHSKPEINCYCASENGCKQLQDKCNYFEEKIKALEESLAQQNLKSDGDDYVDSPQKTISILENSPETKKDIALWKPDSSVSLVTSVPTIDFSKLIRAVHELNLIAGQGESKLCYTKSGATFQRQAGIPLTLYANGIILNKGSFRSYDDESTQQFLQDILDGYFPSEFQNDYPDGVPLQIEDKHSVVYEVPKTSWSAFSGKGYRLGNGYSGNPSSSRLLQEYIKSK